MAEQPALSSAGLRFAAGEAQFVTLATAAALDLVGRDFTFEAWIKPQGLRADADLPILGSDLPSANAGLQLLVRNERLYCAGSGNSTVGNPTVGNTPLQSEVWYHVALRYNTATGTQALLLNGVLDAEASGVTFVNAGGVLAIGRQGAANYFQGVITEVRLWREARSDGQIQAYLYRRLSGQEQNLAGYWPLNEGTGTVASDRRAPISASDGQPLPIVVHDGSIAKAAWGQIDDIPLRLLAPGVEATAVVVAELAGAGAGLAVANLPALTVTNSITVEAWVRAGGPGRTLDFYPILSMHSVNKGWELRCGNGQCSFTVAVNNASYEVTTSNLVANSWYHIAAVYDGQVVGLYVNGVRKSILPLTGTITPYPGELGIGCNTYWPDHGFTGQLAEVRLWNRASTQLEIQRGLFRRLSGEESGLIGAWSLEGDGSAFNDALSATPRAGVTWMRAGVPLPETPTSAPETSTQPATGLRAQLTAARARNATLVQQNKELAEAKLAQEAQFTKQIQQLLKDHGDLTRQLDEVRQQVKKLESDRAELTRDKTKLVSEKAELVKGGGARTTLQDFVQNANESIKQARAELRRQGSTYSLERVSLEVKMLPGPAGEGMFFPQQEDLVGGQSKEGVKEAALAPDHLSTLSLEFTAHEPREKPQIPALPVPSVLDYTELMARRKLVDAGFQVVRDFQAVLQKANEPIQADRVVDQLPRPGEKWPPGGTITIFIGREAAVGA